MEHGLTLGKADETWTNSWDVIWRISHEVQWIKSTMINSRGLNGICTNIGILWEYTSLV